MDAHPAPAPEFVRDLAISVRVGNILACAGLERVDALLKLSVEDLLRLPRMGKKGAYMILAALAGHGIGMKLRNTPIALDKTALSKRELFAGMAMQGSLGGAPGGHLQPENLARESVRHADALLAELARTC